MSFQSLNIQQEYRSPQNNIVTEFYIPVLEKAVSYKRSVGYFSSTSLVQITKGILGLIKNGGTIDLVASPYLSKEDEEAIRVGYENRTKIIENALNRSLQEDIKNPFSQERLNLLACLIEKGILNIKIAFTENEKEKTIGMYHEKLGLMEDASGNKIAFSGSMNESYNAMVNNYETIDVFCSWKSESEKTRVVQKEEAFSKIWGNYDSKLKVMSFPSIEKSILEKYKRHSNINFSLDKEEFIKKTEYGFSEPEPLVLRDSGECKNIPIIPSWLKLHDYQINAINKWKEQNYVGIYDMATGTGKTITALSSVVELFNHTNENICVIILCPYIHLVTQWEEEIKNFGINPIIGFGSSHQKGWKEKLKRSVEKRNFRSDKNGFFCLISTISTFKSEYIQSCIKKIKKDILLIADEAHNLGATQTQKYLKIEKYKYRLALSATLERNQDDKGTDVLYSFFGKKCIEYGLKQAIDEGFLSPYKYFPIITTLNDFEQDEYKDISKSIQNEIRIDDDGKKYLTEKGKLLCILRSRIIASCENKLTSFLEIMQDFKTESNMLIYCGAVKYQEDVIENDVDEKAIKQIDEIVKQLYSRYKISISKFIAEKKPDERKMIIDGFVKKEIQAIAAIKCLDEGVNIPSIKTAFILASSTNPKEYVQRRGRVLRLAEDKEFAVIYDFICLPFDLETLKNKTEVENESFKSLIKNELKRMKEFSFLSLNKGNNQKIIDELEEIISKNNDFVVEDFYYE